MINEHKDNIITLEKGLKSVDIAKGALAKLIDETPDSKDKVKLQISTLSIRKKELAVEKREVNESMRMIRTKARQDRAKWTGVHGKYMGKAASAARAVITYTKEKKFISTRI